MAILTIWDTGFPGFKEDAEWISAVKHDNSKVNDIRCQMSPDERAAETVNGPVQARDQERLNLPQARSVAHLISLLPSRIATAMANHSVRVIKTGAIPSASTGTIIAR